MAPARLYPVGVRTLIGVLGITAAALAAAPAVSGCSAAGAASAVNITSAYVPQPSQPGQTVGYLVIRNNGVADELLSAQTSVGGKVLFRAPVPGGRQLVMHSVAAIPIPAHSTTQLIPNSFHLLITGAGPMSSGKDITLQLRFAHAGIVKILALVTDPETGGDSYFLN